MNKYSNLNNTSGVAYYAIELDRIKVWFKNSELPYSYSYNIAGKSNVERMKTLARQGYGLNGFINTYVKYKYDTYGN